MDHAKQVLSKAQQVEVSPARWKVLLALPIVAGILYTTVVVLLGL